MEVHDTLVLGAGLSGLGAGRMLGARVYEASDRPGGVCHSYYVDVSGRTRDPLTEAVDDCFRFEPAGGHWLFGMTAKSLASFAPLGPLDRYERRAAAFFPTQGWLVPYPVQNHLSHFPATVRARIEAETALGDERCAAATTFKEWLLQRFGPTLCELFFFPFNERYTAGLYDVVAPQDAYKTPAAQSQPPPHVRVDKSSGYNPVFYYPRRGLDTLVRGLAAGVDVHYGKVALRVDLSRKIVTFADGSCCGFRRLVSSVPLDRMAHLCQLEASCRPDPATAVLVVNVAAERAERCPTFHWVYVANSKSGLHRVGFYSEVDALFLPRRYRQHGNNIVSLYAERSFRSGQVPTGPAREKLCRQMVAELCQWGFIGNPLIMSVTVTDPAYTWSWPASGWAERTCSQLARCGVQQIGRYGSWRFQGMVSSYAQGVAVANGSLSLGSGAH